MQVRNFRQMLEARWAEGKFVCVGLDPVIGKIPQCVKDHARAIVPPGHSPDCQAFVSFCAGIVEATKDMVCAFKPNAAFFEAMGPHEGMSALHQVIGNIHSIAPGVPVILDAKRGDIGNTNDGYVRSAFEQLNADAITVHPYLGKESLQPFLDQRDRGVIVLCRTSNKGAGEFQDLEVRVGGAQDMEIADFEPLYCIVARQVARSWNENGNCALVVGATYPEELARVRKVVGDIPILIPGIGAQGGEVEKTVKAGKDSRNWGMIINSSRGIIFASSGEDFAEAAHREALKLSQEINRYRQ